MKKINFKTKKDAGMSYVELIVVISIFGIMSSIVLFNYQDFNARLALKSLANDVALKIVGAQKVAMSGELPSQNQQIYQSDNGIVDWRPSYGLYFGENSSKIIYFSDLDDSVLAGSPAYNINQSNCGDVECIDEIATSQNYSVGTIVVNSRCGNGDGGGEDKSDEVHSLSVSFVRPDSRAYIQSVPEITNCPVTSAKINLTSSGSISSSVTIYPSGRIQLK